MRSKSFGVLILLLLGIQAPCQQIISEHVFDVSQSRNSPTAANAALDVPFRFQELFPTAWKTRNISADPLTPNSQDVLGTIYLTESGSFNPGFTALNGLSTAGLADTGTRFLLRFSGVPQGIRILAPVRLNLTPRIPIQTTAGSVIRIAADAEGKGPYSPVAASVTIGSIPFAPVVVDASGNGHAVWELVRTPVENFVMEELVSGVIFSYDAGAGSGSIWISGGMAPTSDPLQNPVSRPAFAPPSASRVRVAHFRNGQRYIDRSPLPPGRTGLIYSAIIAGSLGSPGFYVGQPVFELLSGQLPPGLTLSQTGVVSGTPQSAGSYDFRVRIRSLGDGVTVESPVLNISVVDPVRVNPFPDAVEDLPYSAPFQVSGGRPPYQIDFHGTIGPAPSMVPANVANTIPRIAGFAAPAGSYVYDVTVTDADGKSLRTTVPLRILPASGRPTFRQPAPNQVIGVPGATVSWNPAVGAVSHEVEVVEPTAASDIFGGFVTVGRNPTDRVAFSMNIPATAGNSVFRRLTSPTRVSRLRSPVDTRLRGSCARVLRYGARQLHTVVVPAIRDEASGSLR